MTKKDFFDKHHDKVQDRYFEIACDEIGEDKKADELEKQAYDIALETITAKNGNWPNNLIWGYLENRHIIRAIDRWAFNLWRKKETNQALDIFRKLLRSNLGDNVGARFNILAIRMGLEPDYDEKWAVEHGIDAGKLLKWWDKNHRNYMDEFKEWEKEWGDRHES